MMTISKCCLTADAIRRWGLRCTTLRLPQKQIRCTTVQIWHTAPLLYSVCYRLINFTVMKEIIIKIKFDDEGGYKGHGDDTAELIIEGIDNYMNIDLESDGVIKKGWTVELVKGE